MVLIGWVANRRNVLPDSAIPGLTNLMLYITTPCMVLQSIYSKKLTPSLLDASIQMIICGVIFFFLLSTLSILIIRGLNVKPKEDWGVYVCALASVNSGFMGLPVTAAIFGGDLFYLMVMFNIVLNIYLFGVIPVLLHVGTPDAKFNLLKVLKDICTNIIVIFIFIGIIMLGFGYQPPESVDSLVDMLGDTTVPLSMLLVGMQLGSSQIKSILASRINIALSILGMFVVPALVLACTYPLPFLDTGVKAMLLFGAAFPTAVAPVALAAQAGKNSRALAEVVTLTTLISLVTLPLTAVGIMSLYY